MKKAVSDNSLYFRFQQKKLVDIVRNYVDNKVSAGDVESEDLITLTLTTLKPKTRCLGQLFFFWNSDILGVTRDVSVEPETLCSHSFLTPSKL